MSKNRSLQHVLAQAKEKEKKYDWLRAVEFYGEAQTGVVEQKDFLKAGEIQERIGFCFHRAAMQAGGQEKFRERMRHAVEAYEKAHGFYEKLTDERKAARMFRCDAVAKYLGFWLASDPSEKRKLLRDCLELEGKALAVFLESRDMLEYGRTYNELPLVFFCRLFLEWDRKTLKRISERGLKWGEKAVAALSELGNLYEIARAYLTLATWLSDFGYMFFFAEPEQREKNRLRIVKYLSKAIDISEKVGDAYLLGLSHMCLIENTGGEESIRHSEKTLECGKLTRDNFLISVGLDYQAYLTYWKAIATEDPEKRRELAEKAMQSYDKAQHHFSIMSFMSRRGGVIGAPAGHAEHYLELAGWETDPKKRLEFLKKSEKAGMEALKLAEDSDMPVVIAMVLHVISKTLESRAHIEPDPPEKRSRLEKALKYREKTIEIFEQLTPFHYWNLGVMQNYLAGIKAELADIEPDLDSKRRLLEEAGLSKEKCLKLCNKMIPYYEKIGDITLFSALHGYQDTYATLLTRLYNLTNRPEHLRKAIEILQKAAESANKLDMVSLIAESSWKIAEAQDILGEHLEAAQNFEHASKSYVKAAEKIHQLKDFYQDYASYMKAWNEIEKARYHHTEKRYGQAKEHYEKAANLHKSTERWNYLSPNYLAWARLEEAEDLSRRERAEEARDLFQQTAKLFVEARKSIKAKLERIEVRDEKKMATDLVKASEIRREYCLGRIAVEEAKILDRRGDHVASSEKYGLAAEMFQNIAEAEPEQSRKELKPIIYLCQAWQKMMMAEARASPIMYEEAAELFEQAKEHTLDQPTSLLALAHSSFCKALEAGTEFEITRDMTMYSTAKKHMETASNYYLKAGFKTASEYARATHRLFDAYMYMNKAETETEPGKKAQYYQMAEKLLQASAGSYMKAKHPEKSEEVRRLLESVKEDRQLAMSLTEVLHAPTVVSTTTSFSTPSPTHEKAVGLEKFEHAAVEGNLVLSSREAKAGEDFNLEMQITNVGKEAALLDKVEEILPADFELIAKPGYYHFEDAYLDMKGKRLPPLKTEEIRLVLRSFDKGTFAIKPKIIYVDETSHQMFCEPEPVTIKVSEVVLPGRITTGYGDLDKLLFGGIPRNYAVILTAPSCNERDLLIKKFLEAGAKEGEVTFCVTIDASGVSTLVEEFQSNFYFFICNPQADKIIENLPNVFKLKGVENLTDINIALTSAFRRLDKSPEGPRRACIEIISDVLLQHHAVQTRRWLNALIPELKSKGFTTLAVMDPGMHSSQEVRAILGLFEGEINIYKKEAKKFLKIEKMTNQKYSDCELLLGKEKL